MIVSELIEEKYLIRSPRNSECFDLPNKRKSFGEYLDLKNDQNLDQPNDQYYCTQQTQNNVPIQTNRGILKNKSNQVEFINQKKYDQILKNDEKYSKYLEKQQRNPHSNKQIDSPHYQLSLKKHKKVRFTQLRFSVDADNRNAAEVNTSQMSLSNKIVVLKKKQKLFKVTEDQIIKRSKISICKKVQIFKVENWKSLNEDMAQYATGRMISCIKCNIL